MKNKIIEKWIQREENKTEFFDRHLARSFQLNDIQTDIKTNLTWNTN